ncbi:UDP-glucuronosyltransferase 2B15, partial [Lemmus lemmus]
PDSSCLRLLINVNCIHLILGHPKTKAFVTHGGANGIYEAIHFGIPMIGIPLFAEQHDNIAYIVAKGAAVSLDFRTMTKSDLINALEAIIDNPVYKKNVMLLSTIHHDQPMKPLDRAVFWVEFVMRHKGAKHLKPLAFNLTWYQYYSLDVIGFLLACVAATIFLTIKCCLFVYRFFVKKEKNKKE